MDPNPEPTPPTTTLSKWKKKFSTKNEACKTSKKIRPFIYYRGENSTSSEGTLHADVLKPDEIYWYHYSRHSYPDAVPAINQPFQCPFDPTHTYHIGQYGPKHLINCRANHPSAAKLFDICDYDRSHYVPKGRMKEHLDFFCRAFQVWAHEQALRGLPLSFAEDIALAKKSEETVAAAAVTVENEEEEQGEPNYTWDEDHVG